MKRTLAILIAISCLLGACVGGKREPKNSDERYEAASLGAILLCKLDKGLDQPGEATAAWDKLMPNIDAYRFLSSPKGKEAIRILRMSLNDNCRFDQELFASIPGSERIKLERMLID